MANIYTAALMEHNAHPDYKYDMEGATDEHEGVNPSCGDEMVLKLRIENGVISFNVDGIHPHDVASILDMDQVAIRAGHHCAQPLLTWLGVENLACCRASLAFYNDKKDVDALIAGLGNVWRTFNG